MLITLLVLLVLLIAGWIYTGRFVARKGFEGTGDFIQTVSSNYISSFNAHPEKLYLDIKAPDFQKISRDRKIALKRGVIINEPGSFVPATITYQGEEIKCKIRLKGHMTDHISGDQWSFRVKVEDKGSVKGMKLFSIQHPGTRGYIHEWIYHALMKQEGIIALRYSFIEVYINGKSNGIYAIEENFDKELLENNGRLAGPLVRFNPDLYWVNRYNEMLREKPVEEFSSFQSARLEAYRENKFISDPENKNNFLKAIALMDGFREGRFTVPQVFDIPKLARFHSIIDLLGGYHSLDWSDVKYYFNPVTLKFEPVAYESFAVFPTNTISGLYRFRKLEPGKAVEDLHVTIFSDPAFYAEYIRALTRISQTEYLDAFFATHQNELKKNLAILNKAFPYKKFEKTMYYRNQFMIRKILNAPQGVNAYYQGDTAGVSTFRVGNLEALPYELIGVKRDSSVYLDSTIILPSKQLNEAVKYYTFSLPSARLKGNTPMYVLYRIPGSKEIKETEILSYMKADADEIEAGLETMSKGNYEKFTMIREENDRLYFIPGTHTINEKIIIPKGRKLVLNEGVKLVFEKNGSLLSYSPLYFIGGHETTSDIVCNTESGSVISVVNQKELSVFMNIRFKTTSQKDVTGKAGVLYLHGTSMAVVSCIFDGTKFEDAVTAYDSRLNVSKSLFNGLPNDAFDLNNSYATIVRCSFEKCNENAVDLVASTASLFDLTIDQNKGKAINVKQRSQLYVTNCTITNTEVAVAFENSSFGTINGLTVKNARVGITAFENNKGYGLPKITVTGFHSEDIENPYIIEEGAEAMINGKIIKDFEQKVKKQVDVR